VVSQRVSWAGVSALQMRQLARSKLSRSTLTAALTAGPLWRDPGEPGAGV